MPPDDRDAARLWDMLTYATEIQTTLAGIAFVKYVADKTLRLATERRMEIIGEAARNVSPAFKKAHPEIPWRMNMARSNRRRFSGLSRCISPR